MRAPGGGSELFFPARGTARAGPGERRAQAAGLWLGSACRPRSLLTARESRGPAEARSRASREGDVTVPRIKALGLTYPAPETLASISKKRGPIRGKGVWRMREGVPVPGGSCVDVPRAQSSRSQERSHGASDRCPHRSGVGQNLGLFSQNSWEKHPRLPDSPLESGCWHSRNLC